MKTLEFFRKPFLSVFMACAFLFLSCSDDNDTPNRTIDYSAFEVYKTQHNQIFDGMPTFDNTLSSQQNVQNVFDHINSKLGTSEQPHPKFHQYLSISGDEIMASLKEDGRITQNHETIINSFMEDVRDRGFDTAINNYENTIAKTNMTDEEFVVFHHFANSVKSMHHFNPNVFDGTTGRGWWACFKAKIAYGLALSAHSACLASVLLTEGLSIPACALTYYALTVAYDNMTEECGL